VPVVEALLDDIDPLVRQVAEYASAKASGREAPMPKITEIVEQLGRFGIFEGLGSREMYAVASIARAESLRAGDVLLRAGEANASLFLILSGKITIFRDYGTPDQKEARSAEGGGYVNFAPMFDNLPPQNTSVVVEDSEVLVLPQSHFHEIVRVYPHIALNMLRVTALAFRKMGLSV